MSARDDAGRYLSRGFSPIPIPYGKKGPVLKDWQTLQVSVDSLDKYFTGQLNVGVLLGSRSGDLVDVDLDAPEALEFAARILPPTATFGRKSKPKSHWLYRCVAPPRTIITDPIAKEHGHNAMLLEIRGDGHQTVFPNSVHPEGERIEWSDDCDPIHTSFDDLHQRARFLGAVCLLRRYWPPKGSRHEAAMAVIGLLTRAGIAEELVAQFVTAVNAGESYRKHQTLARNAATRIVSDRPLLGIPKLCEIFGEKLISHVLDLLGIASPRPSIEDIALAIAQLSTNSTAADISSVLALLRAASVGGVKAEEFLKAIKRQTGTPLHALRREYEGGLKRQRLPSGQAHELVEIGKQAELWYDAENRDAYATIHRDGHDEQLRIGSQAFTEWLSRSLYDRTGAVPDKTAIGNAQTVLAGLARIDGKAHRTWLRVAKVDDAIYVDLGDAEWRCVRITPAGWETLKSAPVRFRRTSGHALPVPERGGSIEELRPFVNADDQGFMLIVSVALNAFRPDKPFPILHLAGEKGSAKSTLLVLLRKLIDPAAASGAGLPLTENDLVVVARSNWLVSGDNVSRIRGDLADALCRLSTGGGLRKRALYTNDEEFAIDVRRPVMITGLSSVTDREDFLDRVVMVTLDRIEGNRKTEEEIVARFSAVHARILGALFDGLATAIRRLPFTRVDELPRMADFILWATAASVQFGWEEYEIIAAYESMRAVVFEEAALGDPIVKLIADWLYSQQPAHPGFDGSPSELLTALSQYAETSGQSQLMKWREWPKSPSVLVRKLRAVRTGLAQLGVETIVRRDNDNRSRVSLTKVGGSAGPPIGAEQYPF